jgi:hypothetical protein
MRRGEVGLSFATGLLLVLFLVANPAGMGEFLAGSVLAPAANFWFLGVAALVASVVLRARGASRDVVATFGFVGIAWTTFVAGSVVALLVLLATSGQPGL